MVIMLLLQFFMLWLAVVTTIAAILFVAKIFMLWLPVTNFYYAVVTGNYVQPYCDYNYTSVAGI